MSTCMEYYFTEHLNVYVYLIFRTLEHYLNTQDKPLQEAQILAIFKQIVQAMLYTHMKNILHR